MEEDENAFGLLVNYDDDDADGGNGEDVWQPAEESSGMDTDEREVVSPIYMYC